MATRFINNILDDPNFWKGKINMYIEEKNIENTKVLIKALLNKNLLVPSSILKLFKTRDISTIESRVNSTQTEQTEIIEKGLENLKYYRMSLVNYLTYCKTFEEKSDLEIYKVDESELKTKILNKEWTAAGAPILLRIKWNEDLIEWERNNGITNIDSESDDSGETIIDENYDITVNDCYAVYIPTNKQIEGEIKDICNIETLGYHLLKKNGKYLKLDLNTVDFEVLKIEGLLYNDSSDLEVSNDNIWNFYTAYTGELIRNDIKQRIKNDSKAVMDITKKLPNETKVDYNERHITINNKEIHDCSIDDRIMKLKEFVDTCIKLLNYYNSDDINDIKGGLEIALETGELSTPRRGHPRRKLRGSLRKRAKTVKRKRAKTVKRKKNKHKKSNRKTNKKSKSKSSKTGKSKTRSKSSKKGKSKSKTYKIEGGSLSLDSLKKLWNKMTNALKFITITALISFIIIIFIIFVFGISLALFIFIIMLGGLGLGIFIINDKYSKYVSTSDMVIHNTNFLINKLKSQLPDDLQSRKQGLYELISGLNTKLLGFNYFMENIKYDDDKGFYINETILEPLKKEIISIADELDIDTSDIQSLADDGIIKTGQLNEDTVKDKLDSFTMESNLSSIPRDKIQRLDVDETYEIIKCVKFRKCTPAYEEPSKDSKIIQYYPKGTVISDVSIKVDTLDNRLWIYSKTKKWFQLRQSNGILICLKK